MVSTLQKYLCSEYSHSVHSGGGGGGKGNSVVILGQWETGGFWVLGILACNNAETACHFACFTSVLYTFGPLPTAACSTAAAPYQCPVLSLHALRNGADRECHNT